jgi:signal transduction histidine kinase
MYFDDRLATVLRIGPGGERAARTQFRQLVDLLGSASRDATGDLLSEANVRLGELNAAIDAGERAAILREPGTRLRNARLVRWLAEGETQVAAAAMAAARLTPEDWETVIPALPVPARSLLRHRRDLPRATRDLLARLGIYDLILPEPEPIDGADALDAHVYAPEPSDAEQPLDAHVYAPEEPLELGPEMEILTNDLADDAFETDSQTGFGELVRRIETFRRARGTLVRRRAPGDAPLLPLGEIDDRDTRTLHSVDFASDAGGRVVWAAAAAAPMAVGLSLLSSAPDAPARAGEATLAAMRGHQPVRDGRLVIEGAPAIAGEWRVDAAPQFLESGGFAGYCGRLRRPPRPLREPAPDRAHQADLIRQLLHELRTPVNAIQGFAEVIQQQVLGPAPSEYRALSAAIGMDAARILGGFDELDRMARLETGDLTLDAGSSDLAEQLDQAARRLDGVLRPRSARIAVSGTERACLVPLGADDAAQLAWRVLGTIAGALSPGEVADVFLRRQDGRAMTLIQLPAALEDHDDLFAPVSSAGEKRGVSAGMFGPAFSLRLARAEANAAGGDLVRQGELLILSLPLLTGEMAPHSHGSH